MPKIANSQGKKKERKQNTFYTLFKLWKKLPPVSAQNNLLGDYDFSFLHLTNVFQPSTYRDTISKWNDKESSLDARMASTSGSSKSLCSHFYVLRVADLHMVETAA